MSLPEIAPELARKQLRELAAQSTPGPRLRRMRTRYAPAENHGKAASVLMLFGMIDEELSLLFTQRSTDLRHHPGQVAFPGGARDATDPDAIFTALREAEEEIGLLPHEVEVLGTLPPIPVAVSGFLVTPVLAWWKAPRQLLPLDPAETARVFTVMISHMGQEQTRVKTRLEHDGRVFSGPGFDVGHSLIWGFSAFLTEGVLEELGWMSQAPQGWARTVNPRDYESEGS